jgi:predicted transposase YdaD
VTYDALFKELLRTFFQEFMERFFPEEAARLDFSQVTFLEKELATDVGSGHQRTLDLIAHVRTRSGGAEFVLIHVEFEGRYAPDVPPQMFEDYGMLRRRHRIPVLPIVVYITGGRGADQWEEYRDQWFDRTIVLFSFLRLRLKGLKAREVVREADPLAAALGVLADRRGADPAVLKATSLDRIARARLDEARQWVLVNFVETYLPLQADAARRYQEMLAREEHQMARQAELTWGDRVREEGREEGRLGEKRAAVLKLLGLRFREVPEDLRRGIERTTAAETLDALFERAATASRIEDLSV